MRLLRVMTLATLAASAVGAAHGQVFVNLDFESATVPGNLPVMLSWEEAAPGWGHSPGDDTHGVYYRYTHVGTTQWFQLLDAALQPGNVLAGRFSLAFSSGYDQSNVANPNWVNAYLSQTAVVPATAMSMHFLATGPLEVYVAGERRTLVAQPGAGWAVDVSEFSGQLVDVRFQNASGLMHDPVVLDNIGFSPVAVVPEPAAALLFLTGLVALAGCSRSALRRTPSAA